MTWTVQRQCRAEQCGTARGSVDQQRGFWCQRGEARRSADHPPLQSSSTGQCDAWHTSSQALPPPLLLLTPRRVSKTFAQLSGAGVRNTQLSTVNCHCQLSTVNCPAPLSTGDVLVTVIGPMDDRHQCRHIPMSCQRHSPGCPHPAQPRNTSHRLLPAAQLTWHTFNAVKNFVGSAIDLCMGN